MKAIRYLTVALLILTGIVHIAQLSTISNKPAGSVVITALFGVAYLVIAFFIFKENKKALWFGAILPLIGLVLTLPGLFIASTTLGMFFVVVDSIVIACCAYLIYRSK